MNICIWVLTSLGLLLCAEGAIIPSCANCADSLTPDGLVCYAEPECLPAQVTFYDPKLGGTNCEKPCHLTADGSLVDDCYWRCAACPMFIPLGTRITIGGDDWYCHDRGGAIGIKLRDKQVVAAFDVMIPGEDILPWYVGRKVEWGIWQ